MWIHYISKNKLHSLYLYTTVTMKYMSQGNLIISNAYIKWCLQKYLIRIHIHCVYSITKKIWINKRVIHFRKMTVEFHKTFKKTHNLHLSPSLSISLFLPLSLFPLSLSFSLCLHVNLSISILLSLCLSQSLFLPLSPTFLPHFSYLWLYTCVWEARNIWEKCQHFEIFLRSMALWADRRLVYR